MGRMARQKRYYLHHSTHEKKKITDANRPNQLINIKPGAVNGGQQWLAGEANDGVCDFLYWDLSIQNMSPSSIINDLPQKIEKNQISLN